MLAGLWPLPDGSVRCPTDAAAADASSGQRRPAVFYVPQKPYTTPGSLRDQVLYPLTMAAVMAPRYAAGGGRAELDAELAALMAVVRLRCVSVVGGGHEGGGRRAERARESVCERGMVNGWLLLLAMLLTPPPIVMPTLLSALNTSPSHHTAPGRTPRSYLLEREGGWDTRKEWGEVLSLGEQQRLGMARLFFHRPHFGVLDECTNATSGGCWGCWGCWGCGG